jgi:phage tail-like protein
MTLSASVARVPNARNRPRRDPDWMVQQLPVTMTSDEFFVRFVSIFQHVGETLLEDADTVEHVVDLTVAPPTMVRWLGSWIGLRALDESLPEEVQRLIVSSAARTLAWRGTAHGLRTYLGQITGGTVHVEEGGGVWPEGETPADTAWLRVRMSSSGLMSEQELVEVVRDEVPAHVRAELYVADRLLWSTDHADDDHDDHDDNNDKEAHS